ncbi:MAG: hypothetical protein VX185_07990 [Pseudomonadota bacterium]|nr:hypothetical protein [Pseudomonadota bacterium]
MNFETVFCLSSNLSFSSFRKSGENGTVLKCSFSLFRVLKITTPKLKSIEAAVRAMAYDIRQPVLSNMRQKYSLQVNYLIVVLHAEVKAVHQSSDKVSRPGC